jgi:protein-S-isoprenylcysteine O-methyltransferase Ste14
MNVILKLANFLLLLYVLRLFALFALNAYRNKLDLFGAPPIEKKLFLLGKFSNFACWAMYFYQSIASFFSFYQRSATIMLFSTAALAGAAVLINLSFKNLGNLNKFGLPEEKTGIVEKGLYAVSRNPMYLGFYLLNIASIIYYPQLFNLIFGILGIYLHHQIVLGEEKYMEKTFGDSWVKYSERVKRYI